MITLHNGCWISEPTVFPKNWQTQNASTKKDWYIQYYFHDPAFKDDPKLKNGKLKIIKGMNHESSAHVRRKIISRLITELLETLIQEGFNPITKQYYVPPKIDYEIEPTTPFSQAVKKVLDRIDTSRENKYSLKSSMQYIGAAAKHLHYDCLLIQEVRRRHIKLILEQCKRDRPDTWSNQTFNHYRAYLMMVFKELLLLDAIEQNPVTDIPKMPIERKIKSTLSQLQRTQIDSHLNERDPNFRRYIHIFFHSGGRSAELGRLQGKAVDLQNQRFKVTVIKGNSAPQEEWRPIKNLAIDFWVDIMKTCGPEEFLFSRGFKPGKAQLFRTSQTVSERWRELVKWPSSKGGLGIDIDFYSLKHLNLDETAHQISEMQAGIKAASEMAGHATPVVTLLYAQGEKARQNERLKQVGNKFA